MPRLLIAITFLLFSAGSAAAVGPSFEVWTAAETQLTLSPETDPNLAWHDVIPDRFRIYTEHQFAHDIGLQQSLLRVGPIWNLLPWFSYSMHLTSAGFPSSTNNFNQEVRLEFEPTFRGEFLPEFRWVNRHRFEYRMRPDSQFWRYRTRLGLNYHIPDSPFTPLISNEFHFHLDGTGFNQNRFLLGVSYQLNPSTQISLSYLNRMVLNSNQWIAENGLMLSMFYSSREDGLFQGQSD